MAVYFIVNAAIKDMDLLLEYQAGTRPVLAGFPAEVLVVDNEVETVEGEPVGSRVVVVKFESKEAFREFYESPGYQAVIGKRFAATEGFGVLVEGFERPS